MATRGVMHTGGSVTCDLLKTLIFESMNIRKLAYRITHWETWHYLAKYIPLFPAWAWFCIRSRSIWFFTPSNPTLTFGGFEGERKREMYEQLPSSCYPKSIYISPTASFEDVQQQVESNNFTFPFAVKPDIGMMGFMFRTIENSNMLRVYHQKIPADYIIQELISYPLEVSVFYYRFPDNKKGTITGFLKKEYLEVAGDGKSTLSELIHSYKRVQFRLKEILAKHETRLNNIIPAGEIVVLSQALNLSRGGKLVSLAHEIDERLLKIFDDLSNHSRYFYYGRYDIKCASVEDLKQGKNYSILEFNGCGAEPHHIYGNHNTLFQAYRIVLHHWNVLYKISRHNYNNGISYWNYSRGLKYLKQAKSHFALLKQLDIQTEL